MIARRICVLVLLVWSCQSNPLYSQISFVFSETGTGGVKITGTGTGTTSGARNTDEWDVIDFDNDFLSDSIASFNLISADSVSGTFSNSRGVTRSITGFGVNRSAASNDDISWSTASKLSFSNNEDFTLFIEATFDNSTLAYSDVIAGFYRDAAASSQDEVFGITTISVQAVPEPTTLGLASMGMLGLVIFRRRRKQVENTQAGGDNVG